MKMSNQRSISEENESSYMDEKEMEIFDTNAEAMKASYNSLRSKNN